MDYICRLVNHVPQWGDSIISPVNQLSRTLTDLEIIMWLIVRWVVGEFRGDAGLFRSHFHAVSTFGYSVKNLNIRK